MSDKPKIIRFPSLDRLVARLRDDFVNGGHDFVLLYAYNGTGKTRLSMEFKDAGKRKNSGTPDTLYFNAFTEDLFSWENDLATDSKRFLRLNSDSQFFGGLDELDLNKDIQSYLGRYTDLTFEFTNWTVSFRKQGATHIKISRGEERLFIWCLFMTICERVIAGHWSYAWVEYLYIDDPVSSLDDNNAIAVASDLARILQKAKKRHKRLQTVVSSHHALFFNVVCNELKAGKCKRYFLHRPGGSGDYTLRATDDTPFFHHVAMLAELRKAADSHSGTLFFHHFNMLRGIMEKTAVFFGKKDFSECLEGVKDEALYARALNLRSHEKYSLYAPVEMSEADKQLFRDILAAFLNKHAFDLPALVNEAPPPAAAPIPAAQP
ncbi:anticodon nuclease [Opitutaceae bacterium TAV5]|nr:anticodon nuclease [Opitutaceae bacterium TAV5]